MDWVLNLCTSWPRGLQKSGKLGCWAFCVCLFVSCFCLSFMSHHQLRSFEDRALHCMCGVMVRTLAVYDDARHESWSLQFRNQLF